MDDQPKKKQTVMYGKIANEFRDAILADQVKELTKRKNPEQQAAKSPKILTDPQGVIIRGRILRFKPTIMLYAKNFGLGLISRDDFLIATRNDTRKFLNSVGAMGRLMLAPDQIEATVRDVVDTLYQMTEGLTKRDMDIQMAIPIVDTIMGIIEKKFNERAEMPLHDKIEESRGKPRSVIENDPLNEFPPEIRELLLNRLPMLGINPRDMTTLKRLARQMGVDPDEAIAEMKEGRIPEKLKNFL